ncbi:MAG TPA: DUF4199 domain-containing protein [Puia sp.]|nr:DUF4199 domain-containing protein [Puia sp.]
MAATKKIPVPVLYGAIAALGMILVTLATYYGGVDMFIGNVAYLMYLFPIALAVVGALVQKKVNGGILGFQDALKACFGVIVLALAVQTLFTWILVRFIDPRFGQALPAAVLAKTEATFRRFGVPEDEISKTLAEEKGKDPFSLGRMLTGLARNYIVGFPVAVLLAAIIGQRLVAGRGPKA